MASGELEPPPGADPDWDELYVARGTEVLPYRPVLTGDVYTGVTVTTTSGRTKSKSVMILQHPCTMRGTGAALKDSLLVASLRHSPVLNRDRWGGSGKLMPLPDVLPDVTTGARHQAAFFESTYFVHPDHLLAGVRIACLSEIGMYLVLQRWMFHSSRLAVPTPQVEEANSHVYAEADLGETWGETATNRGEAHRAAMDFDGWLSGTSGGTTRRDSLKVTGGSSKVQRDMKAELRTRYLSTGVVEDSTTRD